MKKYLAVAFGAFLWLATLLPAQATILFAGSEDINFNCTGTCTANTNAGARRSAYARYGYYVVGSAGDPPSNYFSTPTFTASADVWIHAQFCVADNAACLAAGSTSNIQMLRVYNNAGNPALVVRGTGTLRQLKVSSRTAGGVFTDLVTCSDAFNTNTLAQLDLNISYGASGSVTLYNNGTQVCTYTGNVTNGDGGTTINRVEFASPSTAFADAQGTWSEVIIATTDTRSKALLSLTPNGNGNAVQWTGTNPCTNILPATTANDASYIQSGTNNQLEQCTVDSTFPAGTWRVDALVMGTRILKGATGPQHFQFLTRTGGADFTSSDFNPTGAFSNIGNYIQETNPQTAAPWDVTDITAVGFNVGLKSTP